MKAKLKAVRALKASDQTETEIAIASNVVSSTNRGLGNVVLPPIRSLENTDLTDIGHSRATTEVDLEKGPLGHVEVTNGGSVDVNNAHENHSEVHRPKPRLGVLGSPSEVHRPKPRLGVLGSPSEAPRPKPRLSVLDMTTSSHMKSKMQRAKMRADERLRAANRGASETDDNLTWIYKSWT